MQSTKRAVLKSNPSLDDVFRYLDEQAAMALYCIRRAKTASTQASRNKFLKLAELYMIDSQSIFERAEEYRDK